MRHGRGRLQRGGQLCGVSALSDNLGQGAFGVACDSAKLTRSRQQPRHRRANHLVHDLSA